MGEAAGQVRETFCTGNAKQDEVVYKQDKTIAKTILG